MADMMGTDDPRWMLNYLQAQRFARIKRAGGSVPDNIPQLTLAYSEETSTASVATTGAGRLYWAIFGAAGATSGDIVSGAGASDFGFVDTLAGSVGIDLPALVPGAETWLACALLPTGGATYVTAEVRTQAGAATSYATVASVTGSPAVYDYTDGDGTWRAYEWLGDGSLTLSAPGDVEHLVVAGGGGAGGMHYIPGAGAGAGGLLQATEYRTAGVYPITVGLGGLGSYGSVAPEKGGNSTVFGLVTFGGGASDEATASNRNGGSGAGRKAGVSIGQGTGVPGQGFAGGGSFNTGGEGAAAGGGGAASVGLTPVTTVGGNGGAGIDSSILGFSKGFAGGGVGASNQATTTASGSHGAPALGATTTNRKGADGVDGTGAGGSGSVAIATSSVNRGGKGGNGAVIIRVRVA